MSYNTCMVRPRHTLKTELSLLSIPNPSMRELAPFRLLTIITLPGDLGNLLRRQFDLAGLIAS